MFLSFLKGNKKVKIQEDALNFLHEIPNELLILTGFFSLIFLRRFI